MGHERTCADEKGRTRLSGSPQKPRKFGLALGRFGRSSCPFLIWIRALEAGFTQTA
jgi:hypothetical protein